MTARTAWVGLGSNLDGVADGVSVSRLEMLRRAVAAIAKDAVLAPSELRGSHVLESRAIDPTQPNYLNAAVSFTTPAEPRQILASLLAIENKLGRVRVRPGGSRTIDLDLLAATDETGIEIEYDEPGLQLPHPRALTRDFVLVPLAELTPGLRLNHVAVQIALQELPPGSRTIVALGVASL